MTFTITMLTITLVAILIAYLTNRFIKTITEDDGGIVNVKKLTYVTVLLSVMINTVIVLGITLYYVNTLFSYEFTQLTIKALIETTILNVYGTVMFLLIASVFNYLSKEEV